MLRFIIVVCAFMLCSCNKISVVIDGTGISEKSGSDSVYIRFNEREIKQPMKYFMMTRVFEFSVERGDSLNISVNVPEMKYKLDRTIPYSDEIHLQCQYYFDDSVRAKYITYDSMYYHHPDKLKFRMGINDKTKRYQ